MENTDLAYTLIPRCPICGARLNKIYDSDLECWCWVCPDADCGYIEPIL